MSVVYDQNNVNAQEFSNLTVRYCPAGLPLLNPREQIHGCGVCERVVADAGMPNSCLPVKS